MFTPSYLKSCKDGVLKKVKNELRAKLLNCDLCNNLCRINRSYAKGNCESGLKPVVSSYCLHFGEEPILVGDKELNSESGVGNIFFGNCNLKCVYCQNFQISQNSENERLFETTESRLSEIMIELQEKGANSIGFVSPTHFIPQILSGLELAVENGLNIPLIYNTNAYDSLEVIKLISNIIDIYLPDLKYYSNTYSYAYSKAGNYFQYAKENLIEMYNQIGSDLLIENGVLKRGIIIRHLILPDNIAGSYDILKFISELDKKLTVSLMAQYYPAFKAGNYKSLSRSITEKEYFDVLEIMDRLGLENGFIQELNSVNNYVPDFHDRKNPF